MEWNFWTRKRDRAMAQSMAQMQEQLSRISDRLMSIEQQMADSSGPVADISEQVRKLSRLQYKMGQDFLGKLAGLGAGLAAVQEWQAIYTVDSSRLDACEQQLAYLQEVFLTWLDDFDLLAARLREPGQELWQQLVTKWTSQTLQALQVLGMREINVLGTSFNPQIAECIGTVGRPSATACEENPAPDQDDQECRQPVVPYEIAEVVKRGFAGNDGSLRRKAHVIVYETKVSGGDFC